MSEFIKLYDGLIVKCAENDPEAEFRYEDSKDYQAQLENEIAGLQAIIAKFSSGDEADGAQMVAIDDKFPDAVKAALELHNTQIGYNGAMKELEDKQALLQCLLSEAE